MRHRFIPTLIFSFALASTASAQVDPATYLGDLDGDNFGHSLSAGGDINGDGFLDFIIGAQFADEQSVPQRHDRRPER